MSHQHDAWQLERYAERKGLTVEYTASKHIKFVARDGRFTLLGGTPGSYGALKRAKSNIDKLAAGKPITREMSHAGLRAQNAG